MKVVEMRNGLLHDFSESAASIRVFGRHRYLLAFLLLLLPVQFETALGFRFAPSDALLIVILLTGATSMVTYRRDWSIWHLLLVLTLSFSLVQFAIEYGSVSEWAILNKYVGLLLLIALYFVVSQFIRSFGAVVWVARLFLISAFVHSVVALALYVIGQAYEPLFTARLAGLLIDPNAYGGLMVVALCLHWCTVNTTGALVKRSWAAWLFTGFFLANILFTFSRSAWIGLAVVVFAAPAINRRCWPHVVGPILLGAVLLTVFFRSYFATELVPLILRPAQVSDRVHIVGNSLQSFLSHPLFGSGLGSFLEQYGVQVHNSLLWMLAEMGVIGALVFLGFIGWFVARGVQAYRHATAEQRALIGGLLLAHLAMLGLSIGIEAFYQRYWWVVMALLAASARVIAEARVHAASQKTLSQLPPAAR